jgi:glycolate oxidase FAD binding subunit
VIKNVAGYDLTKLAYGSLGTLGLIAEVVLRVHPRPDASVTVVVAATVRQATGITLDLLAAPVEPSAVDWIGDPGTGTGRLAVRFEGSRDGVAAQAAQLHTMLAGVGAEAQDVTGAEETELWREFGTAHRADDGQSVAFAGTLPSHLPAVADALARAADRAGVPAELATHSALGLHTARFGGPAREQAQAFDEWRRDVLAQGGTVLLRDRPAGVDELVDPLGPAPDAAGLLSAVLSRLDPDRRCGRGRLGSWV